MTVKTEDEIAREKEAVAKMIGAKGAMEQAIDRINRLQTALKMVLAGVSEIKRVTGHGALIRTVYGPGSGEETMYVVAFIDHIDATARKVL